MARYRRVDLDEGDRRAAAVVSLAVGALAGVVSFYVVRLMLSREELPGGARSIGPADEGRALRASSSAGREDP